MSLGNAIYLCQTWGGCRLYEMQNKSVLSGLCLTSRSLAFARSPAGSVPWQYPHLGGSLSVPIRRTLDEL